MTWDTSVHFGIGRQRGAGASGFHPGPNNSNVFTGLLFRGDSRGPQVIFSEGFQTHAAGVNIAGRTTSNMPQVHKSHGTTRGVVSFTTDVDMAIYWSVYSGHNGWVYAIYVENEPWAASAEWNLQHTAGQAPAALQSEIMLLNLDPNRIWAARGSRRGGPGAGNQLHGLLSRNVRYTGTDITLSAAVIGDPNYGTLVNGALI